MKLNRTSLINPDTTYHNNILWTPRFYQASSLSPDFLKEIRKFRRIRQWKNEHVFALTQLILIEAIRDTTFDYTFNYKATPSFVSLYHGTIDCLLFQKYDLDPGCIGVPFIPVLFPKEIYKNDMNFIQEIYSPQRIVSIGLWWREHMHNVDKDLKFWRALYTNGHQWRLFEIHDNFVKKTAFFTPRKEFVRYDEGWFTPRFFDDYEHMLSIIGLIRFALCIRENIVEHAENIELLEQDQNKIVSKNNLLRRQDNQVFKQIPFERKEVPPALEPGSKEYIKLDNK